MRRRISHSTHPPRSREHSPLIISRVKRGVPLRTPSMATSNPKSEGVDDRINELLSVFYSHPFKYMVFEYPCLIILIVI